MILNNNKAILEKSASTPKMTWPPPEGFEEVSASSKLKKNKIKEISASSNFSLQSSYS
jgi:hypothetical protein